MALLLTGGLFYYVTVRIKFIVSGQVFESFSPDTSTVAELVDNVLTSTGNDASTQATWEARTEDGKILEPERTIGSYFEQGELGELCGTVFLNPSVGIGAQSAAI